MNFSLVFLARSLNTSPESTLEPFMDSTAKGNFVWTELMTTDPDAAKVFYPKVVGWLTAPLADGDPTYTMWMVGGRPVGGVTDLPDAAQSAGALPHWLSYIGTADVGATVEHALLLGAEVLVPPRSIPSIGHFSVLRDPQGATFAIHASEVEHPEADQPVEGDFTWYELVTSDRDAALDFYGNLFGWAAGDAVDMGAAGIYQLFRLEDQVIGGIYDKPEDQLGPPAWLAYVMVVDLNAAVERCREAGGTIVVEPMEVPGGDRIAIAADPQEVMFALHSRGPAHLS